MKQIILIVFLLISSNINVFDENSRINNSLSNEYQLINTTNDYIQAEFEGNNTNVIYEQITNGHVYACANMNCTLSIIEYKHFYHEITNSSGHYDECTKCGKLSFKMSHSYDYAYVSSSQHLAQCTKCSYSKYESHEFMNFPISSYAQIVKKACKKCGYIFL